MPVGDLSGWKQVFAQDFSTAAPLGRFASAYPGWAGYDGSKDTSKGLGRPASQQGVYDSATTSSVANGIYDCYLHTQGGTPQVCALTPALGGKFWNGQRYGRYSVRFKIDDVPGYKIAWLLWPSSNQWSQGEIDFPEADLDSTATATAHQVGNPSHNEYWVNTGVRLTGWHTATIEWVPGKVTFDLDGSTWQTTKPAALPTNPMRWALQAETQLSAKAPSASAAGHIDIDWLTAYQYQP
jgi:hypothetical protein